MSNDFLAAKVEHQSTGTAEIACRVFGSGEPLLLVHGWPLWGFTWRKVVPRLAAKYRCHVIDLPGCGSSRWQAENDFSFTGQAANVARFLERAAIGPCHVVAQDTGATIARQLALTNPSAVRDLVLIGTEIPGHRPPWIQTFQRITALPGSAAGFRLLLRSRLFLRSSMGFGNCFFDRSLVSGEFVEQFVRPLIDSSVRLEGAIRYLRGIDWALVDGLATAHARITCPTLLLWGEDDPTFPIERARGMVAQLPACRGLKAVSRAKLLVHEEQPEAVAGHILEFLG